MKTVLASFCITFTLVTGVLQLFFAPSKEPVMSQPSLTIAAEALARLTEEPELHATPAYMPPTVVAMLAPFERLTFAAVDLTLHAPSGVLTFRKGWDGQHVALHVEDLEIEFTDVDGKTFVAKWEEKK